ncbi:serine/threonine protein phosphatase, putative [Trypanosoma brucei gambiense DAL972]|uniref:Serine/threonine protein phosphatase, putative n=2 Tax=Trypanosoma brucei TaxID=5691 RepID=C9ZM70_TRYB9|nr:serine/threonine protein phosphatase, putative [Trypanosoma brucei gambiense DAL972]RHW72958.1 kinetoplastid-specific phospho-protein phosphatase [Trypanosoma brucei equiperdum]CBH10743.1 serine/threonine protein phosphatase, putative [Trypanosoma brucei gambiense DAL972]|eukprot:XP_011773031.1 serine/threonine protein phosphatase, putative [Trypanosoma brucei gambiense DAL972]
MKAQRYASVLTLDNLTGRLVVVGDIHGCLAQLQGLLRAVSFKQGSDTLVAVGDLVNKGPDSFGVVRLLKRLGAHSVFGNHDVKLLKLVKKIREKGPLNERDTKSSLAPFALTVPVDVEVYLSQLPHIIRIPAHNVIVTHGGLHPQRPLDCQYIDEVTILRNLIEKEQKAGGVTLVATPETKDGGVPWASLWRGPETVVFGHDSRRGLQEQYRPLAIGLDSGCVYGGRLSAAVFPGGHIVSVSGWRREAKL